MDIDERLGALTMNLELAFRDIQGLHQEIQELKALAAVHSQNIESLTRLVSGLVQVAESHERRIANLES